MFTTNTSFRLSVGVTLLLASTWANACGKERWAQKVLADPESANIDFSAVHEATIEQLIALPAPAFLHSTPTRRPSEQVVYRLHAVLIAYKLESDGDFHVVLGSLANPSKTLIVEIPDPACLTTAYRPAAYANRHFFDQLLAPKTPGHLYPGHNIVVAVTGVLFFDFKHGQTGVAPNAVELHPVLSISLEGKPGGGLN